MGWRWATGVKGVARGKRKEEQTTKKTTYTTQENLRGQYDENDSPAKLFLHGMLTGDGICLLSLVAFVAVRHIRQRRKLSNGSQIVRDERQYVNTAITMQAISSTVTESKTTSVGSNKTSDETSRSVYDSLDGDRRDDQHQYSGLERQTDHHSTNYTNL
ncbi:uncharacterized protein LOC128556643 [Mercenaria mercenaria]|uniref:uncharacterized protein LOC128556643 n=1 Tax=Mercenaria mercenaria TaxID=6596 RepID=UPI00234E62E3|nr:uncharacterized protein LOC128556643 [Mercenaria mercenaria]